MDWEHYPISAANIFYEVKILSSPLRVTSANLVVGGSYSSMVEHRSDTAVNQVQSLIGALLYEDRRLSSGAIGFPIQKTRLSSLYQKTSHVK